MSTRENLRTHSNNQQPNKQMLPKQPKQPQNNQTKHYIQPVTLSQPSPCKAGLYITTFPNNLQPFTQIGHTKYHFGVEDHT